MANGILGTSFDDPRTRFNIATAMGLLEAGGPSLQPTSIGQAVGRAGMMGMQAYDAALKAQQAKRLGDIQFKTAEAQLAKLGTEAAEARRRSQLLGQLQLAATPEARASIFAQLDPAAAAKAAFEQRFKAPTTQEFMTPSGATELRAYNPATRQYDITLGMTKKAPDPKTITSGGVTGTMGRDVFGRPLFSPLAGAPVTPQKLDTIQTGVSDMPGATQQNVLVPDPSKPSGYRLEPIGPAKTPKPTTGTITSIDPETGNITITSGVPGADLAKPTVKSLEQSILEGQDVLASLDAIDQKFDPSFLTIPTQLTSYGALTMEKLTGIPVGDADQIMRYSQFRASTQELFSTILKQLSGAAVTKFELNNAKLFLPDVSDSPTQFKAKLDGFRNTTAAAVFRAQQLRAGTDKITDDLARKYPLSLKAANGQDLYIDDFVQQYLSKPENADKTQADALALWAESAKA